MNADQELAHAVRSWLRAHEDDRADRVLGAVLDALDTTPQRDFAARPLMTTAAMLVAVAAVVVGAVLTIAWPTPPEVGAPDVGSDVALPIAELDLQRRPGVIDAEIPASAGPAIQVASGRVRGSAFSLTVYRDAERPGGLCWWIAHGAGGDGGCGPIPGEGLPEFGPFGGIGESPHPMSTVRFDGMVAPEVARVWVVTDEGRADAVVIPDVLEGVAASAFVVFLPSETHATSLVAADGSGRIMHEVPILPVLQDAPPDPTAVPTPMP
jgi:hypothetical protein